MIDVNEVEPDRLVTNPRLAGRRVPDLDLLPAHRFGPTGVVDTDGKWHDDLLQWSSVTV